MNVRVCNICGQDLDEHPEGKECRVSDSTVTEEWLYDSGPKPKRVKGRKIYGDKEE